MIGDACDVRVIDRLQTSWLTANQNGSATGASALAPGWQANRFDANEPLATLAAL
ncbi:MAG: hypothetical protein QN178_09600 [Armatimonadota bacterium]|nr:hypothetical protein [Armatimonadota bacterium]